MKKKVINHIIFNKSWIVIAFIMIFSVQTYAQGIQTDVPALKDVFANDFTIGCLLSYKHVGFPDDPYVPGQSGIVAPYGGDLIQFHMNSMSPGNNMKTAYTVDLSASAVAYSAASAEDKDSINTHPVVRFNGDIIAQLNWAHRQGFTFRGHTLVWHSSAPVGFFYTGYSTSNARVTKEVMIERMDNYIHEVIRLIHEDWSGLLTAMDVVNEAINDNTGTFRTSGNQWYTTFGDNTYVMKAFELADKYREQYNETQMKLYYNDYNTHNSNKADGIVSLLTPIYQAGYLDGIGMQDHDAISYPTTEEWIASYNKFDPICDEMAITEIDVSIGSSNPSSALLTTQANQYAALFKCFVERSYYSGRGKIINVSKDGLNDQYTLWPNQSSSLWDSEYQCKPAYYAVVGLSYKYNFLDSLISEAELLQENDYPAEPWADFVIALNAAKSTMAQSYSASVSAVGALDDAYNDLEAAIDNLLNPVNIYSIANAANNRKAFAYLNYGKIYINNIPEGAMVNVYSFNGALLQSHPFSATSISIPYIMPCIIRIHSRNENTILKIIR